MKRPNKLRTPGPEIDEHGNIIGDKDKMPILANVEYDSAKEPSSIYGKQNPKLPRSFKEMERHGLKITSYTTTEDS